MRRGIHPLDCFRKPGEWEYFIFMNILVTGANGQLGTELREASLRSAHRFLFTDVSRIPGVDTTYLDITNRDAVRLICDSERIDMIVNCAAYTNVDKAEDDYALADLLNHVAPGILAEAAGKTLEAVTNDTDRDHFMSAEEAKAWGVVDKVL